EQVVFNTLVNSKNNVVMLSRGSAGLGPKEVVVANNLIVGGPNAARIGGPMEQPTWQGNIVWKTEGGAGDMPAGAVTMNDPQLKQDATGQYRVDVSSPVIGKAVGSFPFVTIDVNGRQRGSNPDVGAEQFSKAPATNQILTP